jgi:PAS domain S-box-containing protein
MISKVDLPMEAKPTATSKPAGGKGSLSPMQNIEAWLAAIVESSDDAIIGKTLEGIITSWNEGATRIFGYEAPEAVGKPISLLAWPGEEERMDFFLEKLRRGERVEHFEVSRRHKSGKKLLISLSLSPINSADGSIIGNRKDRKGYHRTKSGTNCTGGERAPLAGTGGGACEESSGDACGRPLSRVD